MALSPSTVNSDGSKIYWQLINCYSIIIFIWNEHYKYWEKRLFIWLLQNKTVQ